MNRLIILILLLIVSAIQGYGQAAELNIRKVTVYTRGAEVRSDARVNLKEGLNEVVFKSLSPYLDPSTIQIAGEGFTVMSISRSFKEIENQKSYQDSLKIINDRIADIEKRIRAQNSLLNILNKEEQVLLSNQKLNGEGGTSSSNLITNIEFFTRRFAEIENKRLEINERISLLNKEIEFEKKKESVLIKPEKKTFSEITFLLRSAQAKVVPVEVRYWVNQASWFPTYDIFAKNGMVEFSYNANIIQQTGVDWKDVELTVSSASPEKGHTTPRLKPYWLNFKSSGGVIVTRESDAALASDLGIHHVKGVVVDGDNLEPLPGVSIYVRGTTVGTVTNMNGEFSLSLPSEARMLVFSFIGMRTIELPITSENVSVRMEPDNMMLEEVVVVGYGTQKQDRGYFSGRQREPESPPRPQAPPSVKLEYKTSFSYKVDIPYSVASNGSPSQVEINRVSIPGNLRHTAVPRLEKAAFLTARIPDWEQYNLLDGEANFYLDNQFMGRNVLETRSLEDTLSLSMGRDEGIIVERKRQRDYEQRRIWTNRIKEERVWQTAVRNNKPEKVILELRDVVPVSQSSDIKVEVIDVSAAQHDEETGMLYWILELDPGQSVQLLVHYSVEYPRDKTIVID